MRKLTVSNAKRKEKIVWKEIMRSKEARYGHRLHGVLSLCRGLNCYESAAVWGSSPRSLEYWVRRFEEKGLMGLREKKRPGRPSGLPKEDSTRLGSDLKGDPVLCGYPDRRWTGRLLCQHLCKSYRIDLSVRHCQRLLKRFSEN